MTWGSSFEYALGFVGSFNKRNAADAASVVSSVLQNAILLKLSDAPSDTASAEKNGLASRNTQHPLSSAIHLQCAQSFCATPPGAAGLSTTFVLSKRYVQKRSHLPVRRRREKLPGNTTL